MSIRLTLAAVSFFVSFLAEAESITLEDLKGSWNYVSYAEVETPDKKMPVGAKFEFRADGTLAMTMSTETVNATYSLDGDMIEYSGPDGNQTWKIQFHEPGETLVLEYRRALMFFEKVKPD